MKLANFGAVSRVLSLASVLTLSAVPSGAQIVERSRTWADLIASHPCNSGLDGRKAIVTDAQSSSSIGGGGGSVQVFVQCDGVDTWSIVSIGGSGGGVTGTGSTDNAILRADGTGGTALQSSTVTLADSTGNLQWEGTTADAFEGNFTFADPTADWTWAWGAAGDLVGAGSLSIDNLKLDGNTLSTTNANGSLVLAPNGTGTVTVPAGSEAVPSVKFSNDTDTGIYSVGLDGSIGFVTNGVTNAFFRVEGFRTNNAKYINGFSVLVEANTAGSGAPNVLLSSELSTVLTNEGSTAENYHTLPTAVAGYIFTFVVQDADGMRITAATGDTIRPIAGTAASATGGFIRCATQGAFITLVAINATEWVALGSAGTWTIDS